MWLVKYLFMVVAVVSLSCLSVETQRLQRKEFYTLHKWSDLQLTFPSEKARQVAIQRGNYEPSKLLPVDVAVEYGDDGFHRTFVTIPRLSQGVAYSLAVVPDADSGTSLNPRLVPYPNYASQDSHGSNCSQITSAIRLFIDECWRLWVVDSGQINSYQYCAPQLLAFDLVTDKLIHRYVLPDHVYSPGVSVFTALAVDVGDAEPRNECPDTMVYIADPWSYSLIVYDALAKKSWRIEHDLMRPDKNLQQLNAASDGIFTVSISPKGKRGKVRKLYFHALNSYKEISIPLSVVNNGSLWLRSSKFKMHAAKYFTVIGDRGLQCESEVMDSVGNLYCSLISTSALISWREGVEYNTDNLKVVAYNPDQLKFITGLKVERNSAEEDELWALSSDPKLFVGGSTTGSIKFQIIGCRSKDLQNNRRCTVGAADILK